ncbi:MAG: hypothetical protein PHF45_01155, partial [Candidatus Pacebacteria bacterium]|nr:hypothetical protein [Candidatus Paceibacterota bacterium]
MFTKKIHNKISCFIFSILIINLFVWNLLLVPTEADAACDPKKEHCYSCSPETGECVRDDVNGWTSCPKCNGKCAVESAAQEISTSPLTPSCSGGSSSGAYPVYIVGSVEQQAAAQASKIGINSLEDLAEITGLADQTRKDLINIINEGGPIPDKYKDFSLQAINSSNLSASEKEALTYIIDKGLFIPENLQDKFTGVIQEVKNISGLVANKFLDLIFGGMNIEWICEQLTTAASALPFGIGAVVAQAVAMACPVVLDNVLTTLGYYAEKLPTEEVTQTIPVPTFRYYQWEVGLPGFIKPG